MSEYVVESYQIRLMQACVVTIGEKANNNSAWDNNSSSQTTSSLYQHRQRLVFKLEKNLQQFSDACMSLIIICVEKSLMSRIYTGRCGGAGRQMCIGAVYIG